MDVAIHFILLYLNQLGFHVRYHGDGRCVTFVATHRLAGHFFAYTAPADDAYQAICMLAEMCGLDRFDP